MSLEEKIEEVIHTPDLTAMQEIINNERKRIKKFLERREHTYSRNKELPQQKKYFSSDFVYEPEDYWSSSCITFAIFVIRTCVFPKSSLPRTVNSLMSFSQSFILIYSTSINCRVINSNVELTSI